MRWGCEVTLAVVLFLILILNVIPLNASAGVLTEVVVETSDTAEAHVDPGSAGQAPITGTVTVTNYNTATPLTVTLSVTTTVGTATIDKQQMSFQGSRQTEEFEILIQVPIVITHASDDHSCTVGGTWAQGATTGQVEEDTTQVTVLPFYFPEISVDDPVKSVIQGESTTFRMRINNSGNICDTYNFEVVNLGNLESKSISINTIDTLDVGARSYDTINVDVDTSSGTPVEEYQIRLVATSIGSEGEVYEEFPLIIKVRAGVFGLNIYYSLVILLVITAVVVSGVVVYKKRGGFSSS
jgi:uncharacterized membrane protein